MAKEAIILAGGIGSRLHSVISEIPKPLAPINGIPFLTYLLELCAKSNYTKVILSVGYKYDKIMELYGNTYKDMHLEYAIEKERLGTGGAINYALQSCETNDILVLNGDSIIDINLDKFSNFHSTNESNFSMVLKPLTNFDRYGSVEIQDHVVSLFREKKHTKSGLINTGVYLINNQQFKDLALPQIFSFEEVFLEQFVNKWKLHGYICEGFFIDIGIPQDYNLAQTLLPQKFSIS